MKYYLKGLAKRLGILVLCASGVMPSKAETVSIYDDSFTISNVPSGALGGILSGRWGTWNSSTGEFTQQVANSLNAGYVDLTAAPELAVTLNQTLNLGQSSGAINGIYAPGTSLALAIFTNGSSDAQALNFSSAISGAVLTDSSWITPTFANNANMVDYIFTEATVARLGTFTFNGGNEQIGFAVIPEPSSFFLVSFSIALLATRIGRMRKG